MIDAGTSGGKTSVVDEAGKLKGFYKTNWAYSKSEDATYGFEFNPDQFWQTIIQTAQTAIGISGIDPTEISAIAATSQRHGCVFLNKNGKEVYAGPNRDARGLEVDFDDYMDVDELYEITGHGQPFLFALARLLWFQENEDEIFDQIAHLLTIDGWVNYKLTQKYTIDDTSAAETLLFDIRKRNWSDKILSEFKLDSGILPEIMDFGKIIGFILPEIAQQLGVKPRTPVVMCCGDTQASMVGSGITRPNEIGIVAGSTMPIQLVFNEAIIDPNYSIWTGAYINNLWVIESNAGPAGDIHQWFIDGFLKKLSLEGSYVKFEELALSATPGSNNVIANLGSQLFDAQNMFIIPSGGFSFTPQAFMLEGTLDISSFARATLENLAFAVKGNIEQILDLTNQPPKSYHLVGGLARSQAFGQILADTIQNPIRMFNPEGSSVAGMIAGSIGIGIFSDIEQAKKTIFKEYTIFTPNEENSEIYKSQFEAWKEIYRQSREEN